MMQVKHSISALGLLLLVVCAPSVRAQVLETLRYQSDRAQLEAEKADLIYVRAGVALDKANLRRFLAEERRVIAEKQEGTYAGTYAQGFKDILMAWAEHFRNDLSTDYTGKYREFASLTRSIAEITRKGRKSATGKIAEMYDERIYVQDRIAEMYDERADVQERIAQTKKRLIDLYESELK